MPLFNWFWFWCFFHRNFAFTCYILHEFFSAHEINGNGLDIHEEWLQSKNRFPLNAHTNAISFSYSWTIFTLHASYWFDLFVIYYSKCIQAKEWMDWIQITSENLYTKRFRAVETHKIETEFSKYWSTRWYILQ